MAQKQGSSQKKRDAKTSKGTARGSKPILLTDLQKVLICNGGMGHDRLRKGRTLTKPPKRFGREDAA